MIASSAWIRYVSSIKVEINTWPSHLTKYPHRVLPAIGSFQVFYYGRVYPAFHQQLSQDLVWRDVSLRTGSKNQMALDEHKPQGDLEWGA
jgi:hypothetical protein